MERPLVDHLTSQNLVSTTSLASLVQGYILNCRCEGKSPSTVGTYEEHLRRFLAYCQQKGIPDQPGKLGAHHLREFLWYVASEPVRWGGGPATARRAAGQSTVNHYYRVLNTFFRWLEKEGLIPENPLANLKPPKIEQKAIQALSQADVEALLDRCSPKKHLGCRDRAIILVLLDSGMRVSELADLRIADVDMKTGSVLVKNGKGGKQRLVRIGSAARKALWRYLALYRRGNGDRLLLTRNGEPLKTNAIKLMVRRLGKEAGVPNVHVHKLRHTFAISFLRAGGDIFTLKYLMGHSSLVMVQNYLKSLNAEDAVKAHERFGPVDHMNLKG
jgi:site-specific recombinase XerD